jgi:hypothetical protein
MNFILIKSRIHATSIAQVGNARKWSNMINTISIDLSCLSFDAERIARYDRVRKYEQFFGALKKTYPTISYFFFVDASLIHQIDEPHRLDRDIRNEIVLECPAGIAADDFLLEFLAQHPADTIIVSNDRFRDHQAPKTTRARWRYPSMIVRGQVLIPGLIPLLEVECPTGSMAANIVTGMASV